MLLSYYSQYIDPAFSLHFEVLLMAFVTFSKLEIKILLSTRYCGKITSQ